MRGIWRINEILKRIHAYRRLRAARTEVERFPVISEPRAHGLPRPLIVTLTSYPARYPTLGLTLRSLLDQTITPDRIILWIAHHHMSSLPKDIFSLTRYGLEIRECEDLGSYKKLIPAIKEYGDCYLLTADDDVYYDHYWVSKLIDAINTNCKEVLCLRAHLAYFDDNGLALPYLSWNLNTHLEHAIGKNTRIFPTGVGGILYPPHCFGRDVLDQHVFESICPYADDIWFFFMARRAGVYQRNIEGKFDIVEWPLSQITGLFKLNVHERYNDKQLKALELEFGPVP
jgi:hypothetical protein